VILVHNIVQGQLDDHNLNNHNMYDGDDDDAYHHHHRYRYREDDDEDSYGRRGQYLLQCRVHNWDADMNVQQNNDLFNMPASEVAVTDRLTSLCIPDDSFNRYGYGPWFITGSYWFASFPITLPIHIPPPITTSARARPQPMVDGRFRQPPLQRSPPRPPPQRATLNEWLYGISNMAGVWFDRTDAMTRRKRPSPPFSIHNYIYNCCVRWDES
jgi:hypothetical protein